MTLKKKLGSNRKAIQAPQFPVRFTDIRLLESISRQAIERESLPTNSAIHVQVEIGEYQGSLAPSLVARPKVTFVGWYDGKSNKDAAIFVSVQYQLIYEIQKGHKLSEKQLQAVITQMCMLHSWPYSREIIQSQISRMGLPPVLLPLLAMPPQKERARKAVRQK